MYVPRGRDTSTLSPASPAAVEARLRVPRNVLAGILDLRTGAVIPSMETFTSYVDGAVYRAVDINYWGVTFEADDDHFYATMSSGGRIWLMHGDLATETLRSVVPDVECPSLSPDGTRIVFKKRVSGSFFAPWRL